MDCHGQIIVQNWWNLPISYPQPVLYNSNAHTKFGENPLIFTQVIIWIWNIDKLLQITLSKIDEICPLAIPEDLYNINAHTKFGENPLIFTQVIVRKRKKDVLQADNSVKHWWNWPISNLKPDLHNINAHTKFAEY